VLGCPARPNAGFGIVLSTCTFAESRTGPRKHCLQLRLSMTRPANHHNHDSSQTAGSVRHKIDECRRRPGPLRRSPAPLSGLIVGVAAASNYGWGASQDRSSISVPSPRSCFRGSILTIDRLSPSVWKNDSSCFA